MFASNAQAADRAKLLSEAGVYTTFAVFAVDAAWWSLHKDARASDAAAAEEVIRKHGEKIAIDVYLLHGLSAHADFFPRLHAGRMLDNQNFLLDFMGTPLGRHLRSTHTFNEITPKANYFPTSSKRR